MYKHSLFGLHMNPLQKGLAWYINLPFPLPLLLFLAVALTIGGLLIWLDGKKEKDF